LNKTIDECPVCESKYLKQEYWYSNAHSRLLGGPVTSVEPRLNGSSCNTCGSIFKFNVKGKCPVCEDGIFTVTTGRCGQVISSYEKKCSVCSGKGTI